MELGGDCGVCAALFASFADAISGYGYFGRGAELAADLGGGLEH